MASIVIAGSGTLGDHLPLVGLGRALADRGHVVRMAVNEAMRGCAERAGLEVTPFGKPLGPRQARRHAAAWDHWTVPAVRRWRWTRRAEDDAVQACRALLATCRGADLLVAPINDEAGALVHELLGIPWVTAALMPAIFASPPPALDRATSPDEEVYLRSLAEHLGRVRRRLGLPDRPLADHLDGLISPRTLLASSSSFSEPLARHYPEVRVTGFWFYEDPDWREWRPSAELARFVEREPSPVVLTFSSLPLPDPAAVLATHARAAALLGRRLIVQRGWARFSPRDLPPDVRRDNVLFVDVVPHDWLFARAAAAILHGGIGSIARALRAGCPMVIEPYGNDQFFNARQVVMLGLGVAMHPHRLTPEGLARVLRDKVLGAEWRARVAAAGATVREEDGLARACDLIEGWLRANSAIVPAGVRSKCDRAPGSVVRLTALQVHGPFRGPSGYEHHVREFVRALHGQGVAVELIDIPEWCPVKLPPERRDPLFESLNRPVGARVALQMCMPPQAVRHAYMVDVNYTMFEATRVPERWVEANRKLDLLVVPTESSRQAWIASGMPEEWIRLCPMGIDPRVYGRPAEPLPLRLDRGEPVDRYRVRFLNVSELNPRKNLVGLIRAWLRATSRGDDAVLIAKLGAYAPGWRELFGHQIRLLEREVGKRLDEAAPVRFVYDVFADHEMPRLYASATHYISLSHGEGWDQPMVEAAASGLKLIAPDHSAYPTYLDASVAQLVSSREVPVRFVGDPGLQALFAGANWWEPDEEEAIGYIRAAIDGRDGRKASARDRILTEFTWEKATRRLIGILEEAQG